MGFLSWERFEKLPGLLYVSSGAPLPAPPFIYTPRLGLSALELGSSLARWVLMSSRHPLLLSLTLILCELIALCSL